MIERLKDLALTALAWLAVIALILFLILPQIAAGCGLFHSADC